MNKTRLTLVGLLIAYPGFGQAPQLPPDVVKLKASYQAAVHKVTVPLTKTYTSELQRLKTDYMKKGDLQGALAIDSELKLLGSSDVDLTKATAPKLPDFNGTFTSIKGAAYVVVIPPNATKGTVERRDGSGKITKGHATLRKGGKELSIEVEEASKVGTIIHVEGETFHWFDDGDFSRTPILMKKS
ncbi:MAG: hypothetical protein JNM99_07065 [Verrucomicrobiaceae bacterium]|nr:hypothetical protein [Verrucomicrobiaceae bacterium]